MKSLRPSILALLLIASPLAAIAAKSEGKVVAIKGGAFLADAAKKSEPLALGQSVGEGAVITTGPASSTTIQLPSGGKIVLGPNSRIRITAFNIANDPGYYSLQIILSQGTMTGDATKGAAASRFVVRTTTGVVDVAGSLFQLEYAPAGANGGTLSITSVSGIASVVPAGSLAPVAVQPGNTVTLTSNGLKSGQPQISPTLSNKVSSIENTIGGATIAATATSDLPPPAKNPASNTATPPRFDPSTLISPNGEGIL